MKIPRQTQNAYGPDFGSFKISVRLCARSKNCMKRPVHATNHMIQTSARSSYKKTQKNSSYKKYKGRPKKAHDPEFASFNFKKINVITTNTACVEKASVDNTELHFLFSSLKMSVEERKDCFHRRKVKTLVYSFTFGFRLSGCTAEEINETIIL